MLRFNLKTSVHSSAHTNSNPQCRSFSTTQTRLDFSNLVVQKTTAPKQKSPLQSLVFGKEFTDHMFEVDWTKDNGWGKPAIVPYHKLSLDPSAMVFQYSSEIFEGMKAYKDKQNKIRLFRPEKNFDRLNRSASRVVLPNVETPDLLRALKELLKVDADWIPAQKGYSLYIRPTMIGTQTTLGVGPSGSAKFFIICSPVGPYYPEGWKPVKLLADDKYCRAWPGGTGNAKIGGNYAPGILPQVEAAKKGYTQILWLFGKEHFITEAGTMNMFIFWKNKNGERELVTPPLDGTILEGVTRDSILEVARQWGEFKVSERPVTMSDLVSALNEDRVLECFGAGTAAVVSPIQIINYLGKDYQIPLDKADPSAKIGPITKKLFDAIQAIQYGEVQHPWSVVVD